LFNGAMVIHRGRMLVVPKSYLPNWRRLGLGVAGGLARSIPDER
jgi:hypothetical protein